MPSNHPASQTVQPREHRWSTEVKIPIAASGEVRDAWTRLCTRTDCGIAEFFHLINPRPCTGRDDPFHEHIMVTYADRHVETRIVATRSTFELRCNDYILNEWTESFDQFPAALARLGALIYAIHSVPERMFSTDPHQFANAAMQFHHRHTDVPGSS